MNTGTFVQQFIKQLRGYLLSIMEHLLRMWDRLILPGDFRSPVLGSIGAAELPVPIATPEPLPGVPGGFVYYPMSDSAPNGWGEPYEDPPGTPVNFPLGTVLSPTAHDDASLKQYRRCNGSNESWIVTHRNTQMGGHRWKRRVGRVISWNPPRGWGKLYSEAAEDGKQSAPVFYAGDLLVNYPDIAETELWRTLAVSFEDIDEDNLVSDLYMLVQDVATPENLKIVRREFDWGTRLPTEPWEESDVFTLPGDAAGQAALLAELGGGDLNASCTEATVIVPAAEVGRRLEVRATWTQFPVVVTEVVHDSDDTYTLSGPYPADVIRTEDPAPFDWQTDQWASVTYFTGIGVDHPFNSVTRDHIGNRVAEHTIHLVARYKEDTDTLTRLRVSTEMRHKVTGSDGTTHAWQLAEATAVGATVFTQDVDALSDGVTQSQPQPQADQTWVEVGTSSWDEYVNDTKSTKLKVLLDDNLIEELVLFENTSVTDGIWQGTWSVDDYPDRCGGLPAPYGNKTSDTNRDTREAAVAYRLSEPHVDGLWYQIGTTHRKTTGATVEVIGWEPDPSSGIHCVMTPNTIRDTSSEDLNQPIRTTFRIQGNEVYNEIRTYTEDPKLPTTLDDAFYFSINDVTGLADLRQILARWIDTNRGDGSPILSAYDNYRSLEALFLPNGSGVFNAHLRPDDETTEFPFVYFTGGDLLGLTQAQGDNQRIRYYDEDRSNIKMGILS